MHAHSLSHIDSVPRSTPLRAGVALSPTHRCFPFDATAEFDASFALVQKREFVLPAHLMIHDWAFTDSHYIVLGNRIKLDIPGTHKKNSSLENERSCLA